MKQNRTLWLCGAALICAVASPAYAQAAPAGGVDAGGGEIVVTAQKREQSVQKVGVSVSAVSGDSLTTVSTAGISALAVKVPNLQVSEYSPTITIFNIRGVSQNDFADSQESPIAFYSDEAYVSAMGGISGQLFDLQRVEVLRGPQGTLFGRNATGGLVQAVAVKPGKMTSGYARLTYGAYDQVSAEAAIGGPLTDTLRGRISLSTNQGGAYIRNSAGPDLGKQNNYAARVQLAGDIGGEGSFNLKYQLLRNSNETTGGLYSHGAAVANADGLGEFLPVNVNAFGTCAGCDMFGYRQSGDPFHVAFDGPNSFNRTFHEGTLRYEQKLGGVSLVSVTDYQNLKKRYGEDTDMSPVPLFKYNTAQDLEQFSQELRLSGDNGTLQWVVGGYAIWITSDNAYHFDLSGIGLDEIYGGRLKTHSLAGFGQLEYKVSDLVTLIGGLRYSHDVKTYDFSHAENGTTDMVFNAASVGALARNASGKWSWKAQVNLTPSRNVLFYAGVNRGTKSGGFGTPAFFTADLSTIPFRPETLTNYEAGLKLTLLDGKAHFNTSAFYYDYKDYQTFELVNVALAVRNKQARVQGLEFSADVRPLPGLTLGGFATVLDTKVKGVVLPGGRIVDTKMPQAPDFSLGLSGEYAFTLGSGEAKLATDWKYDGVQYFSTFNAPVDREPARWVGNARISYKLDNGLELAAFVNNLTDRKYRLYNLDLSGPFGFLNQTYARPRWWGVSASIHFGAN